MTHPPDDTDDNARGGVTDVQENDEDTSASGPELLAKKFFGGKIPKAVKDFLKYRHRKWEI